MPDTKQALLVSRKDAAILLGICLSKVDHLVHGKILRPRRIGKRVLFVRSELESLVTGNRLR